jgi:solute carrier family 30 (zinc transporter), member 2
MASSAQVLCRLYLATALCATFLIVEAVGGYLAGSIAVLSDAAHLFADLASFCVAIGASHVATLPSSDQHTYGLKRAESLAALLSMVTLAVVSVGLAWEAVRRLALAGTEQPVNGPLMSGIAAIGVVVNIILAIILGESHVHRGSHDHHSHHVSHDKDDCDNPKTKFSVEAVHANTTSSADNLASGAGWQSTTHDHGHDHGSHGHDDHDHIGTTTEFSPLLVGHHHLDEADPHYHPSDSTSNVNLKAAYLHVLGDLTQSIAVLIAGLIIWRNPTWHMVDPIATLIFCAIVFHSTLSVIRGSVAVLLEEVPPNIDWSRVHSAISSVAGVSRVHDLHIWSISDGIPALSVHCFVTGETDQALRDVNAACRKYGIQHATIQMQQSGDECITCPTGDLICTHR